MSGERAARIHQPFEAWLARAPQAIFIHEPGRDLSFAELGRLVDVAELELRDERVRRGDRVLIVAENCAEHVALVLACSRIGAWSCGVNARMSAGEVAGFVNKADARLVYFTAGVSEAAAAHAQRFDARPSALSGLQRSAVFSQAVAEAREDVAAVIFTSGTSGQPKGVLVSHSGLLHFARVSAESRQLGTQDKSYAYLPMTHIFVRVHGVRPKPRDSQPTVGAST